MEVLKWRSHEARDRGQGLPVGWGVTGTEDTRAKEQRMSGHCNGCGTYHEEDDDRLCGRCVEKKGATMDSMTTPIPASPIPQPPPKIGGGA